MCGLATNEEVYEKKRALFNIKIREEAEKMKKLKTPHGAASSSSAPITEKAAPAASNTYAGPQPF